MHPVMLGAIAQVDPLWFVPTEAVAVSIAFFVTLAVVIIGFPIARAIGYRLERKGATAVPPADIVQRLERMEQAIDAIAIEVERISEGQRFTNRLLSDRSEAVAGRE